MIVVFSFESDRDLERIGDWIALRSPTRAAAYLKGLREACLGLAEFPERFEAVATIKGDFRRRVHGAYSIFYQVNSDHIRIARVIHGAQLITLDRFL